MARDHNGDNIKGDNLTAAIGSLDLLPTPTLNDERNFPSKTSTFGSVTHAVAETAEQFARYQAAVDRWARIFGQPPAPTDDKGRLNPPFVEWMMGYPAGWVTGRRLSRTQELRALGNSQQPQVAALAFALLAERLQAMTLKEAA